MSRYADLWPTVPYWVEYIATDEDGSRVFCENRPVAVKERHPDSWGFWRRESGKYYRKMTDPQMLRLAGISRTPDWFESLERRSLPGNPPLCPHCGGEI
jgi:hypothetical protein